jgi:formate/nitrite transporter FocA (FNT family)
MVSTFIVLEKKFKIKSQGKRVVHYTALKILLRGIFAGIFITVAVLLSNVGEVISGIFSVFPTIFFSTMIITVKEHGPGFSSSIAKSMIFGSPSVTSYAVSIHFLYPKYGIFLGSIFSFILSLIITSVILILRKKIS